MALTVWAAVASSAVFWGLKVFVRTTPAPTDTSVSTSTTAQREDLTRLLGADPTPVAAAAVAAANSRFQLLGVVAPGSAHAVGRGVALIAVDGRPARAYKVGAQVDGEDVLQAVHSRGVSIGPRGGAVTVSLGLPALPAPPTGSAPPVAGADAPGAPAPKLAIGSPVVRPPTTDINGLTGSAPNTLLNNPADMAPPDVNSTDRPATP